MNCLLIALAALAVAMISISAAFFLHAKAMDSMAITLNAIDKALEKLHD